jgi:hypothetical protein
MFCISNITNGCIAYPGGAGDGTVCASGKVDYSPKISFESLFNIFINKKNPDLP